MGCRTGLTALERRQSRWKWDLDILGHTACSLGTKLTEVSSAVPILSLTNRI